jgi:hypothetical protein
VTRIGDSSEKLWCAVGRLAALATVVGGLAAAPAEAAPVDVFCTPIQVVVFTEEPRLHVRCNESFAGIIFFATSTTDTAQASRILSVIQTALVAGRTLIVRYDPADLSGAAIGCLTHDCRLIRAIGF